MPIFVFTEREAPHSHSVQEDVAKPPKIRFMRAEAFGLWLFSVQMLLDDGPTRRKVIVRSWSFYPWWSAGEGFPLPRSRGTASSSPTDSLPRPQSPFLRCLSQLFECLAAGKKEGQIKYTMLNELTFPPAVSFPTASFVIRTAALKTLINFFNNNYKKRELFQ